MKYKTIELPSVAKFKPTMDELWENSDNVRTVLDAIDGVTAVKKSKRVYVLDFDGYEKEVLAIAAIEGILDDADNEFVTTNTKKLTKAGFVKVKSTASGEQMWVKGNLAYVFTAPGAEWVLEAFYIVL